MLACPSATSFCDKPPFHDVFQGRQLHDYATAMRMLIPVLMLSVGMQSLEVEEDVFARRKPAHNYEHMSDGNVSHEQIKSLLLNII